MSAVPSLDRVRLLSLCATLSFGMGASAVGGVRGAGSIAGNVIVNPLSASVSPSATQVDQGQTFQAAGLVTNNGAGQVLHLALELRADGQLVVDGPVRSLPELAGGGAHQETWSVCGSEPGSYLLLLAAEATGTGGIAFAIESPAVLVVVQPSGRSCGGFAFGGFYSPIDNLPVINLATAGSAIPVKFSLGGDQGLEIFAPASPASGQVSCTAVSPVDAVEETVTPGSATLSYDPVTGVYTYVWKTKKQWAGTCRKLLVTLTDDSVHEATFRFRN